MVETNVEYENEIKALIQKFGRHWRRALEAKKRVDRSHLIGYINERTEFLNCVQTDFKTRVACCLRHIEKVPCCKNPKCGKPLPKYIVDNLVEENPRETMFCSHKCVYEARKSPDSYIFFDKQYPTREDKVAFLRNLVKEHPLSFQRILQGVDYVEVAKWIYKSTPMLQEKCYSTSTRLHWILNDLKDFPTCSCEGCQNKIGIGKNVDVNKGYSKHCSAKCAARNPDTKERLKKSFLEKFGVDNPWKSKEVKQKITETMLKNWGEISPAHVPEIISKSRKKYVYNGIPFASKPELAYYIWLSDNGIEFKYHPKIKLKYLDRNGKQHFYYPDFLVNGELQEIKGDQFFKPDGTMFAIWKPSCLTKEEKDYLDDKEERKHQCMLENGVKIIRGREYSEYLNYVEYKYGKALWEQTKRK